MKLEELAMHLAQDMGRGVFLGEQSKKLILQACLAQAGLPNDVPQVIRLSDMIDNLCAEVWADWIAKREAASLAGRPEMLSDRLGYPSSVGDADWHRMQRDQDDATTRPAGADQ